MSKKRKIVLASVLKPVDDTRMYEKFALTLAEIKETEVYVIGFHSKMQTDHPENIKLFPVFSFERISWARFFSPWKFYKILVKLKPEVIIVNTHELLIVSCIFKIIFGSKLFYDVQENYLRNILHTSTFPKFLKPLIAAIVRLIEILSRPFINHYFLAERNYEKEFSFTKGKSTVIENKYYSNTSHTSFQTRFLPPKLPDTWRFLYTGTIARNYGIIEAIRFTNIISIYTPAELYIIGYCADKSLLKELLSEVGSKPNLHLIGGKELVPHLNIQKAIIEADFGIISHQPEPSIENCIPTRIYEYMANKLPFILQNHPLWVETAGLSDAFIAIDFKDFEPLDVINILKTKKFYTKNPPKDIYWTMEAEKLLQTIKSNLQYY
jgi:hypothetical protein